jgi:hypothetical protein
MNIDGLEANPKVINSFYVEFLNAHQRHFCQRKWKDWMVYFKENYEMT